ncbi:unnamed protein product [Psylliodes chrysocephalus]|uniref:folate gamma-glutamyl hydrolase n=1 Tax=Psylliodes chrysocephalus TaxID=3402493 RepID=A0A9P0D1F2_9CUCU|nr:unnamed protein product [Psylliodes chrysocephala]
MLRRSTFWFYSCLHMVFTYSSETPIIGILTQETYIVAKYLPENRYNSFLAASYVKFLEGSGARVVPVWIGQNKEYYERVVNYTNGILFPGGGTYFNETDGYGEAARQIYKLALESNARGVYYPILGICLGMQVLVFSHIGTDIRIHRSLKHTAVPLDFTEGYEKSKLFSNTPKHILHILKSKNVTHNLHRYSITEEILNKHRLLDQWRILSTNRGDDENEFISSMEHKNFPIYGIQFHPEKNIFEFKKNYGIPHSADAVKSAQFFANFFVDECRKNNNGFPSEELEENSLIYNYIPLYTGLNGSSHVQLYVFSKDDYTKCLLV